MEYVEKLIAAGRPDLAAQLKAAWKNAVLISAKEYLSGEVQATDSAIRYFRCTEKDPAQSGIPVGASKTGGYPDLPPEIPYPEMSGFTRTFLQGYMEGKVEVIPESSMQLLAQINLRELAESGADIENRLPKTGMLYFFYGHYGCDVFRSSGKPNNFDEVQVDTPEKAQIAKVIYWDGDLTTLRRTAPRLPYCCGIIPGMEQERAIGFRAADEYDLHGLSCFEREDICDILEIDEYELSVRADKLLGVPKTVNPPYMFQDEISLIQMVADEGSVVSYFWAIDEQALAGQDFSAARFWEDCD